MRTEGTEGLKNLPKGTQLTRARPCPPAAVSDPLKPLGLCPPQDIGFWSPVSHTHEILTSEGAAPHLPGCAFLALRGLPSHMCLILAAFPVRAPFRHCFGAEAIHEHGYDFSNNQLVPETTFEACL